MRAFAPLPILFACACAAPEIAPPSLAPRATEAIDPRLPVEQAPVSTIVSPALRQQLDSLVAQARAGDSAFQGAIGEARRLAAAAGARESESWVVAQQALSAAIAARGPVTQAIGAIDALGAHSIQRGTSTAANLGAIQAAADQVAEIDRRQAETIDELQARLGR